LVAPPHSPPTNPNPTDHRGCCRNGKLTAAATTSRVVPSVPGQCRYRPEGHRHLTRGRTSITTPIRADGTSPPPDVVAPPPHVIAMATSSTPAPTHEGGKHKSKLTLIVSLSAVAGFAFICLPWLMYRHKKDYRSVVYRFYSTSRSTEEQVLRKCGSLAPRRFKYSELKKITKSFKENLGQGGFGVVFRGCLHDGRMVAVKLLKGSNSNREDFLNEVVSISQTSHVNIVSLLGFCLEGSKRALVYEYMPNGYLQNHIYSELATEWETLLKIAIGIARGLEYLHQGCNTRIIHFDIKPHNILLDNEFCPKIADFGLAKLCHLNGSILSTAEARGTVGFIAPEVFSRGFGVVSTKSDVYSYGMVLLEMVRGTKEIKEDTDSSSETYFPHWVYDHLMRAMQECQVAHGTEGIVNKLTLVGLWCIQMTPENRPSMSRVIEMLERDTDDLEMPPKPFLCSPLQSTNVSSNASVAVMLPSS
ncbi:hypothetical protein EJB05_31708, partial [Eragrostis curvula]